MISNRTLLHKHPQTGEPQPIGLGWLDDAMTITGPTEVSTLQYSTKPTAGFECFPYVCPEPVLVK
jgi:hypothetical protein